MVVIRVVGLPMEDTALREVVVVESGVAEGEARLVEVDLRVEAMEVDAAVVVAEGEEEQEEDGVVEAAVEVEARYAWL